MDSPCADRDVRPLPHVHLYPDGNPDANAHCHPDFYPDPHPHGDSYSDPDAHINSPSNIHPNPAADGDPPSAHGNPCPAARAGERRPLD